jgi:hypothetical protein
MSALGHRPRLCSHYFDVVSMHLNVPPSRAMGFEGLFILFTKQSVLGCPAGISVGVFLEDTLRSLEGPSSGVLLSRVNAS